MLARRFTIVCLLVAVFGMSLAILVAEKSRYSVSFAHAQGAQFSLCDSARSIRCP